MSRPPHLTAWRGHLATRFPELSAPAIAVLALYSFGVLLAQVSGLSRVTLWLARHLGRPYHALRKRLSEFYKEKEAKSGVRQGGKRQDIDVAACFAPLLRWVLSLWSGRHLALAIDVTNLGGRFHVLCVSVVVHGVGIPVAWKVLAGGLPEPWNPHWQQLLQRLRTAVPDGWTVIVLSDRGLESPELFRFVAGLGWHPLMRVKKGGTFRPNGWGRFYPFLALVRAGGPTFAAEGRAYKGERLQCTFLACWKEGCAEPWLLLTDLPPEAGNAVWYAFRAWIEQGFKVIKGGGWDWQKTRMEDPGRVERLWLVLAVATLWVVAVGAEEEARERARQEQQRLERDLRESADQAEQRRRREEFRLQKLREALAARRAQQELRRQARERARAKGKAAAKAAAGEAAPAAAAAGGAPPPAVTAAGKAAGKVTGKAAGKAAAAQRLHRIDRQGLAALAALWTRGENRLPQHLHPEPWPEPCHTALTLTEQEFLARQET